MNKIKSIVKPVHLETILFLILYFVITNSVFVGSISNKNIYFSFLVPFFFGLISSFVFLYLFSHRDFFHFFGRFQDDQKKKEKSYLDKFSRFGEIAACILISAVGGPIFLALTIRLLFSKSENRYWIAFISVLIPTFVVISFAKGLIKLAF